MSSDLCTCASQEENPSCDATCINNNGGYQCECSDGYYLFEGDLERKELEKSSLNALGRFANFFQNSRQKKSVNMTEHKESPAGDFLKY